MPKFTFNKLIRDKLPAEYERLGQKATYRTLSKGEHATELIRKIIEEVNEIPVGGENDDIVSEIADVQQALDNLKRVHDITDERVETVRRDKLSVKGGFAHAAFVETLELSTDDEWVEYYRARPKLFPELDVPQIDEFEVPELEPGTYEHYKGKQYEVIGVGLDTESEQPVVVYRPLYATPVSYWVRPYDMFVGTVEINGEAIPRFRKM